MGDAGSETQQIRKKLRNERRMVKNFRLQLIPLAQTPTVSNIRRLEGTVSNTRRLDGIFFENLKRLEEETNKMRADFQDEDVSPEFSQNRCARQMSNQYRSAGITLNHCTEYDLAPTVISGLYSEPYWYARSELVSTYTTQSDQCMYKRLTISTCYLDTRFCQAYVILTLPDCKYPSLEQCQDISSSSEDELSAISLPQSSDSLSDLDLTSYLSWIIITYLS